MFFCWGLCLLILDQMLSHAALKSIYVLSRDCRISPTHNSRLYPNTKHLQINDLEGGLVLYSHEAAMTTHKDRENTSSSSSYPQGFSCELVVESPVKDAKIMMKIESFYIPSNSDDCVENYMYVFDSNTAKTKAMPEAGGERGLCRSAYPRFPVFTTNACICIAFQ
ncbi:hypothetical protein AHF37_02999 [Paragonimus kellicotti]|nr:hypothetical protein AHF37_02999 [Paragonimus kellicotti]